jgi:3-phosphoshikimate 1-carboxyvinyltransferase
LMAALSRADTLITDALEADDTDVMTTALKSLGIWISKGPMGYQVTGCGGRFRKTPSAIFMGNAGTAIRPLTATLALMPRTTINPIRIHGVSRMHERPIGDLVDALNALGCNIGYEENDGFPPLVIKPPGALATREPVRVRGDVSSQFLSSLLMALPLVAFKDIAIEVTNDLISRPYVALTINLMAQFGVDVQNDNFKRFVIPAGSRYKSPGRIAVEGDASSASYFIAAGVLGQGPLHINGVGAGSIQGDIEFARVLQRMGANIGFEPKSLVASGLMPSLRNQRLQGGTVDCSAIPDAAMTLAILGLVCDSPLTLTGIGSWRVKETDRIAAMAAELHKLGAKGKAGADWLTIEPVQPGQKLVSAEIATYDDHRMAMCFSLVPLLPGVGAPVTILDPKCVSKTFPDYFDVYKKVVS